jgi:hypothetical protein
VQIAGEVSLRSGKDMNTLDLSDTSIVPAGDGWIPRASVNLMKFFPLSGVADRVMLSTEFYYNHAGYAPNIFEGGLIDYQKILFKLLGRYDMATVLGLYEPNSYSKYYGMLSASVSRFIITDMTLAANVAGNFNQNCCMVSAGVDYQSLHNFNLSLYLNGFLGEKNTEYTFTGSGLAVQVKAGVAF